MLSWQAALYTRKYIYIYIYIICDIFLVDMICMRFGRNMWWCCQIPAGRVGRTEAL